MVGFGWPSAIAAEVSSELNGRSMDALQETLNRAVKNIPAILLENLISKKLKKQGINAPKALSRKLARRILSGTDEPFKYNSRKCSGNINLAFDKGDADEIDRAFRRFQNELLSKTLSRIAERISKAEYFTRSKTARPRQGEDRFVGFAGFPDDTVSIVKFEVLRFRCFPITSQLNRAERYIGHPDSTLLRMR